MKPKLVVKLPANPNENSWIASYLNGCRIASAWGKIYRVEIIKPEDDYIGHFLITIEDRGIMAFLHAGSITMAEDNG